MTLNLSLNPNLNETFLTSIPALPLVRQPLQTGPHARHGWRRLFIHQLLLCALRQHLRPLATCWIQCSGRHNHLLWLGSSVLLRWLRRDSGGTGGRPLQGGRGGPHAARTRGRLFVGGRVREGDVLLRLDGILVALAGCRLNVLLGAAALGGRGLGRHLWDCERWGGWGRVQGELSLLGQKEKVQEKQKEKRLHTALSRWLADHTVGVGEGSLGHRPVGSVWSLGHLLLQVFSASPRPLQQFLVRPEEPKCSIKGLLRNARNLSASNQSFIG